MLSKLLNINYVIHSEFHKSFFIITCTVARLSTVSFTISYIGYLKLHFCTANPLRYFIVFASI